MSYPALDASDARAKLAPLAKRVRGTSAICALASAARRLADICRKEGKENVSKS